MRRFVLAFLRRGVVSLGFGPIVLAVLFLILERFAGLESLSVTDVCIGIFSLSVLAFIAGGMNAIYQLERLPLMVAILIHGSVLYIVYLATYLVNGWLESGIVPMLVFSAIFVVGYLLIWVIIYSIVKRSTEDLNEKLRRKQEDRMEGQNT